MGTVSLITSDQPLVFRDGRPFGDVGMRGKDTLAWPCPSTVAGAFRTAVGRVRSPDYFGGENTDKAANLARILQFRLEAMLPVREDRNGAWTFLAPRPADALAVDTAGDETAKGLDVHGFSFKPLEKGCGTDLPFLDWLYPFPATKERPSRHAPLFWDWTIFERWLKTGRGFRNLAPHELGTNGPETEERMHVGIEAETGTAKGNALFAACGIRLLTRQRERLGLSVAFGGDTEGLEQVNSVYLGGERRTAQVSPMPNPLPECPLLGESPFLRLVLMTPGDFGGWCPEGLSAEPGWSKPWPNLPTGVRLRSAIVPPWTALSGWDFARRAPKATRKLVPSGAVYVVEVQDPSKAQDVAQALWLRSICKPDSQTARDGFGIVTVGHCDPSRLD